MFILTNPQRLVFVLGKVALAGGGANIVGFFLDHHPPSRGLAAAQLKAKGRANPHFAHHAHLQLVGLQNVLHDGQPQAGAALVL